MDHLVDWAGGVPILVVGTARPELLSRRSGWGGGKSNTVTLSLSPLDNDETARLIAALLDRSVLPAETQSALLRRAGGNPLYAEEFVRMVTDRELVTGEDELPLPESVQGIVAARVDALPDEEKTLLQDASVFGKVFWLGSRFRDRRRRAASAEQALHRLERKEFVRREAGPRSRERASTPSATCSLATWPIARSLVRDAPRSIGSPESGSSDSAGRRITRRCSRTTTRARSSSLALPALTLAISKAPARRALHEAGDRAFALNAYAAARTFYAATLEAWPGNELKNAELLIRYSRILNNVELGSAPDVLSEAVEIALASGDPGRAAEAETFCARCTGS